MMRDDDVLMMPAARRVEVLAGPGQRRRWSAEDKAQIVAESYEKVSNQPTGVHDDPGTDGGGSERNLGRR